MTMKALIFSIVFVLVPVSNHAQSVSYKDSITIIAQHIESSIKEGDIVAFVDFQASTEQFANTVINDLTSKLISSRVRVVERRNIKNVMTEQNFQYSGYVDDESMVSLGKLLGAYAIIIGNGENMTDYYRMNFKMLSVETAEILMLSSINTKYDSLMIRQLNRTNSTTTEIGNSHFLIGLRFGSGFGVNTADEDMVGNGFTPNEKSNITFNAVLYGALKINSAWSIQPEFNFTINNGMEISGQGNTVNINYPTLDIPLLVRWSFVQAPILAGIIIGPYISLPIGKLNLTVGNSGSALPMNGYSFGITGGVALGYKFGIGHIVSDLRFLNDFSSLYVRNDFGNGVEDAKILIRRSINITIGYEISL